jgi:hypothetical protein
MLTLDNGYFPQKTNFLKQAPIYIPKYEYTIHVFLTIKMLYFVGNDLRSLNDYLIPWYV